MKKETMMRMVFGVVAVLVTALTCVTDAGTPPEYINYQGVLRDTAGNPLDGSFDMVFRYYSSDTGGTFFLMEEHLSTGTGQVTATGGLFSVGLGTGTLVDVTAGAITTLGQVFSQSDVWVEVDVGGEILSPRIQVRGAGHALNAARLDGQTADRYLNTSSIAQTKTGTLVVDSAVPGGYGIEARGVTGGGLFVDDSGASEASVAYGDRGIEAQGSEYGGYFLDTDTSVWSKVGWDSYGLFTNGSVTTQSNLRAEGSLTVLGHAVVNGLWNNDPDLYLNQVGPDATASIYFHEGGVRNGVRMFWNNTYNRFEFSNRLQVTESIAAPTFLDSDNTAYYVDPANSADSARLYGDLRIGDGSGTDRDSVFFDQGVESVAWDNSQTRFEMSDELAISGPLQVGSTGDVTWSWTRFGTGLPDGGTFLADTEDVFISNNLEIGGTLGLSGNIRMMAQGTTGADQDQWINFYDSDNTGGASIRWVDSINVTCGSIGPIYSGFKWDIQDNSDSGWMFSNGTDYEMTIDELGNVEIDGSLYQAGSCDLAETFFGPEGIAAGTVVVLDPLVPEGVRASDRPYDGTVAGVVTTRPGLLLSGPSADAYPVWKELEHVREMLTALPPETANVRVETGGEIIPEGEDNAGVSLSDDLSQLVARRLVLEQRATDLELALDEWERGDVAVALVGRVPVKVDASYGPVRKGDYLTTSSTPGHARLLDRPGPYLGIAMEDLSAGQGEILVFLDKGWYGGAAGPVDRPELDEPVAAAPEVGEIASSRLVMLDGETGDGPRFSVFSGNGDTVGSELFRVDEDGNVFASGSFRPAAMDVAEFHPVSEPVEVGDVLVADRGRPGEMALGRIAADPAVVGIVSTEPGVLLGSGIRRIAEADVELSVALEIARAAGDTAEEARLWAELEERFTSTHAAIALSGTVPCKVDAGFGPIEVGDLLTVSPTPGHAMRAADPAPQGTVLGKALERLEGGTATIRVLVMMR